MRAVLEDVAPSLQVSQTEEILHCEEKIQSATHDFVSLHSLHLLLAPYIQGQDADLAQECLAYLKNEA